MKGANLNLWYQGNVKGKIRKKTDEEAASFNASADAVTETKVPKKEVSQYVLVACSANIEDLRKMIRDTESSELHRDRAATAFQSAFAHLCNEALIN